MSGIIGRVANALFTVKTLSTELDWQTQARAAVESMRVPTPEMIDALCSTGLYDDEANIIWTAVVNSMLSEKETVK
jgi:hypothetical protein